MTKLKKLNLHETITGVLKKHKVRPYCKLRDDLYRECYDQQMVLMRKVFLNVFDSVVEPVFKSMLSPRELTIIKKRFFEMRIYEEIGKDFHVTRERVRQVETKALEKLLLHSEVVGKREVDGGPEAYTPIETAGFSPRTLNSLINAGLGSLEKLSLCSDSGLSNTRGLGTKALKEIKLVKEWFYNQKQR